jgi:hypothetical protein
MSDALRHLAARVAADPFFLAHSLDEYARSEGLGDDALAARLGCRAGDLAPLRLCRAPRAEPSEFRADVAAVAERFHLDAAQLAEAVRLGQGLARLRQAAQPAGQPGYLLAARDAEEPPP